MRDYIYALTKTMKKDPCGNCRADNLKEVYKQLATTKQAVFFDLTESDGISTIVVKDSLGNEIGEISRAGAIRLGKIIDMYGDEVTAHIQEIQENEKGTLKCKIRVITPESIYSSLEDEGEIIYTNVAGVTKKNDNGDSIQKILSELNECAVEGRSMKLVREPQNRYDKNAIKVFDPFGEHIGYINKELALDLAPRLDAGGLFYVYCKKIIGGPVFDRDGDVIMTDNWGCSIKICIKSGAYGRFFTALNNNNYSSKKKNCDPPSLPASAAGTGCILYILGIIGIGAMFIL